MFELKVQLVYPNSKPPVKKYFDDAGFDLFTAKETFMPPGGTIVIDCGIKVCIPEGYFGLVVPRSSWRKKGLLCLSVYDSQYRGIVTPFITNCSHAMMHFDEGERVLQLIPVPIPLGRILVVDELPDSLRGENGVGSTGKN